MSFVGDVRGDRIRLSVTEFEKTSLNLRVTQGLDDQLTGGELIRFVDLAQLAEVDPDAPVGLPLDDENDVGRLPASPSTSLQSACPSPPGRHPVSVTTA